MQINENEARIEVTTELQAFGLIVTAEPYFAVTQPSDVVVMENVVRDSTKGKVETMQAKYDLLKRGSYLMNQRPTFKAKRLEPGAPLDLAEARNAVELARIAGADRLAADTFSKAARLLAEAEVAREKRKRGNEMMMPARQAVQTAEDARLIALQRLDELTAAQQRAAAAQREREALERAQAEEARRRQAEVETQTALVAKSAAERERFDVERARQEACRRRPRQSVRERKRRPRNKPPTRRRSRHECRRCGRRRPRPQRNRKRMRSGNGCASSSTSILETRETARGLIMNVPDVLFDSGSATLTTAAREKLARVAGILASHPDLHVAVEGHTDNVGGVARNQRLSERRAASVLAYLVQQKIPLTTVDTAGFGKAAPWPRTPRSPAGDRIAAWSW